MKLYFSFGFGMCAKMFMRYGFITIPMRRMMVSHMLKYITTTHNAYIDDIDKHKIYKFKKLGNNT